ncbi:MAG: type VI secretion system tip protein VgrG [Desulfobacteraceae bacterium]|nr:MAG: type VI secretion system tip protein VgrG [Desulfobacteraceae bacterium]
MAFLTQKKFDFVSSGLAPNTFAVVRFRGAEGFSRCYEFEIELVSTETEIDLDQVLSNPATFTILREDGDIPFHGILAEFDQQHQVDEYVFYRAVLVPKLWWLSLTHHNQVFLEKNVTEIFQDVLKDGGLTTLDFDLRLQGDYPKWEYICQYRESHLNFVSRWMEREGIYFYFEQEEEAEKAILTDSKMAHQEMEQGKTMYYSPPSGMDESHREEVIKSFVCRQKIMPKSLKLKDYNYRTPSLDLTGSAEVKSQGRGEVYIYGEHFRTSEEGDALAKIRAEELLCQEKRFYGEGTIPYLRPGFLFDLQDHYRSGFNQTYLTIELTHEGSQTGFLLAGIQKGLSELEEQPYYRNSFVAIPADVQFRPERRGQKSLFHGSLSAKIDASESSRYAELDEQGRYKVILPFDLSGRKDGKASAWLRMVQPYTGADFGMHFPLHKGTEVLLTFIDGDPDRPVISGAAPNPDTPSVVTSKSETPQCDITTCGGNEINFQDEKGHERIVIRSPKEDSVIKLGDHLEDKGWLKRMGGFDGLADAVGAALAWKATLIKAGFSIAGLAFSGRELGVEEGIELRSDNGLKIRAIKKEEVIGGLTAPGNASTSVTGVFQESVKGYSAHSVLGYQDDGVKGFRNLEVVGSNTEKIYGDHDHKVLGLGDYWVVGLAKKVYGGLTKAAGWVKKGYESVVELVGSKQKVTAEEIEMTEMKTELVEEETSVKGEEVEMVEARTGMVEAETSLVVEEVEVGASFTRMAEEETSVVGDEIEMCEMSSSVIMEENELRSEKNIVAEEVVII